MPPAGYAARSLARKLLIWLAIPSAACMAYWPLRMAWADHLSRASDAETVARAVHLSQGNAEFRLKLAAAQQATGDAPAAAIEAAAALDPGNAEVWIRLSAEEELRGDLDMAAKHLLQAARVCHQFAPRWALANFYFRRGDEGRFWPWVKQSLWMGYGDMDPVFRLCWNKSQDAGLILDHAIPQRREVLAAYVRFLMEEGRLGGSEGAAIRLAELATIEDRPILVAWCNRQLDSGATSATLKIWNTMCARQLLPFAPLDPDRAPLNDGDFLEPSVGGGFDWREAPGPGATIGRNRSPRYLWIAFNGDQPEVSVPLSRLAPVTPNVSYRLRFEYHTAELPAASGLHWNVFDGPTGIDLTSSSPFLFSMEWKPEEVCFRAPARGLVRLALTCQRVPGATRVQGSIALRHVSMERRP